MVKDPGLEDGIKTIFDVDFSTVTDYSMTVAFKGLENLSKKYGKRIEAGKDTSPFPLAPIYYYEPYHSIFKDWSDEISSLNNKTIVTNKSYADILKDYNKERKSINIKYASNILSAILDLITNKKEGDD